MALPRLSVFVRAFGEVSENPSHDADQTDLKRKRPSEIKRKANWCGCELGYGRNCKRIFFFYFQNTEMISCHQINELKNMFGNVVQSTVHKMSDVVQRLTVILPDNVIHSLKNSYEKELEISFGQGIKFTPLVLPEDWNNLEVLNGEDWISNEDGEKSSTDISLVYTRDNFVKESAHDNSRRMKHDSYWLNQLLELYYDSADDLVMSTTRLLLTSKSNEELQNDLCELLGFDHVELCEVLLKHRKEFVELSNKKTEHLILKSEARRLEKKPAYACYVTIQSEYEKEMAKQIRKGEKKIQRQKAEQEDAMEVFDGKYLKQQREISLIAAMTGPIFRKDTSFHPRITYPNVYDSYMEAKQSASYISGQKMSLPVGFERKVTREYEEVSIPANESPPTNVGSRLKPISELDEIGRSCFQGIKTLNRIQTVVFDTAYHSNENLLICAPTGAGKTNIAMLAIVHEIKQHMENGTIKKDNFKIVYVAPMKALAAEMVQNFSSRLESLQISVKELTGDMQLTKTQIANTQIIVTTPEKWDVITRKGTGDVGLTQLVRLLIFDEVHLLHGDRGPVVEALVARTLRQVESSQSMIRIIGLSATLPNYLDVAEFLRVNPQVGLFYFDSRFRPVPLSQTFIGVKAINSLQQMQDMDNACYDKVSHMVDKGHQVMIFVHARNATYRTATVLREIAKQRNHMQRFEVTNRGLTDKQIAYSRNRQLMDLIPSGFSIHHAGMLRQDRNLVERLFREGIIKVLVCTSTLAWGVNLPAHAVIIRGTEIYDSKHGSFVDLSFLDVLQIFGRAGRPQYDSSGHGTIITTHDKLAHYLSLLTCQCPIESQFEQNLTDNLNAEIVLGTVATIDEAIQWLRYTYLFVRMQKNPLVYGIKPEMVKEDPTLIEYRIKLIKQTAQKLDKAQMIRYVDRTSSLHATDLGRTASHFYIKYHTVELINEMLQVEMNEGEVIAMVSQAEEFNQLKVREDEMDELEDQTLTYCKLPVKGGKENTHGKVNILLQTHISRGDCKSFSLISDLNYITQNGTRILRALFEVVLRRRWALMSSRMLELCKVLEQRMWPEDSPLHQFSVLRSEIVYKLEEKNLTIDKLKQMDAKEIGHFIYNIRAGPLVKECVESIPVVNLEASIHPITREILRVRVIVTADFRWSDKIHGNVAESFWVWVEDPITNDLHHYEHFVLTKNQVTKKLPQELVFTIPFSEEETPSQFYVKIVSDHWIGSETIIPLSFQHLILPERHPPHTELLDLDPLPINALNDHKLEALYNFTHFNPIQTQIFHTLYHTDGNVLIGAPTGSGKTIAAEVAMFRVFRKYPGTKIVFIAPLKALVRERIEDWKDRLEKRLGKLVVEMTGDITPDVKAIEMADVIVTTPEKWDGVSRSWQTRNYVKSVALIIIDEIHLLGEDRGPVLEVIVSRTNFISSHGDFPLRIIGLSTALANARDLADWLGIKETGLYNFRPSVRPVPLEVHMEGFSGKHYCPRMASMNKPTLLAIKMYSPDKPVLVFVSSRRQTRLTALDLIAYLAAEENPKQWLLMEDKEMDEILLNIKDVNLKLTLAFGIGIHHAGLQDKDRKVVEGLFVRQKIQVLIATATLAWGVNFPAHLVVIKGTEYYDGKTRRYVDVPVTDVLQMMGRAGRPQFDDHGVAMVFVHDVKKVLADHLNAEIVSGAISSKQNCLDYLTWTYFFRRLLQNPNYYELEDVNHDVINKYLSNVIEKALRELEQSTCITIEEDARSIQANTSGRLASYYYLHHGSVRTFQEKMRSEMTVEQILGVLCDVHEYSELPVRHNEDTVNGDLARSCPFPVNQFTLDSPHTKANLLFQAHFSRLTLPSSDYVTDLKSVMDQAIRILQAMLDVAADHGWLATAIGVANMIQMVLQARWVDENSILTLPHLEPHHLHCFKKKIISRRRSANAVPIDCLPALINSCAGSYEVLAGLLRHDLDENQIDQIYQALNNLPQIHASVAVNGWWEGQAGKTDYAIPIKWSREEEWVSLHADQEYWLNISLQNITKKQDSRAFAPRFPKPKAEGWFLILGDVENKELIALKRVGFISRRSTMQLSFFTPLKEGRVVYTLYIISDSYLGLDQQYDLHLEIIPVSLEAQVNTELILNESMEES
uniref:U5 small nuclear ribonucleoprotein 200 kDa helicase n=1 Tax=Strigamia maritima TaxID=126957 RepID=T1IVJ2_STRMM